MMPPVVGNTAYKQYIHGTKNKEIRQPDNPPATPLLHFARTNVDRNIGTDDHIIPRLKNNVS